MRSSVFETILGAIVVFAAAGFLFFALNASEGASKGGKYEVTARFDSVIGIERGSDVRMAGVKVGSVTKVDFNAERDEAVLRFTLRNDIELRDDSNAKIAQDGLLGGSFVSVNPGGGFDVVATDGTGEITNTQGSVDLLSLFASFQNQQGNE